MWPLRHPNRDRPEPRRGSRRGIGSPDYETLACWVVDRLDQNLGLTVAIGGAALRPIFKITSLSQRPRKSSIRPPTKLPANSFWEPGNQELADAESVFGFSIKIEWPERNQAVRTTALRGDPGSQ